MRILTLRIIPDDERLREQWDALVQGMERPEVFYTYEWAISVQRSYGSILQPLLLLGYEDESLVGVAALTAKPNAEIGFLSGSTADYCDFLSAPDLRWRWCDAVFGELRNLAAGSLALANVPADSATASVLSEAAAEYGYRSFIRPAYRCARIVLGDDERRAALRRMKKDLRRNLSLLDKKGSVVFSANGRPDERDQEVTAFCKAHVSRFLSSGRLSNMIEPERRRFLSELARELSQRGWLSINRLLVGDRCVAWNYGFQFAGSWFWYQPTFDTDYERFSPGLCLLGKVVERACDDPEIKVVDLGLGAEGYKERFATESRQTVHATLTYSPVLCAKEVVRYRLAEMVKARPEAERRVRANIARVSRLRSSLREEGLRACVQHAAGRIRDRVAGQHEVHFFQWGGDIEGTQVEDCSLQELDANLLGVAAIEYYQDRATLEYLLRAAQRLRTGMNRGFALVALSGRPLHFCWGSDLESSQKQVLEQHSRTLSRDAVLISDCWTPCPVRGRGYFAMAIRQVAGRLASSGEMPWIVAAAKSYASVNGIIKAGFTYRFTVRHGHLLGMKKTVETAYHAGDSLKAIVAKVRDYAHSEN